ncbi:MAG: flagellar protein FlgN [Phycisphaerae bacterium]
MTKAIEPKRLQDLLRLFSSLRKLQEHLLALVQSKIDAMRRADIPAMRELDERERAIAKRLHQREGLRRQLMDAIGEEMGLPPQTARALTVSQLASRLPGPQRPGLLNAAEKLREAASKATQVNRVAGVISREILNHLKWVFASVKPADGEPVGYAGDGALVAPAETRIFETVG